MRPVDPRVRALRRQQRARALRRDFFPGVDLFDPSWDMLLELEVTALEERRLSISDLCMSAECPPTTALRHLAWLEQGGWVVRARDPADRRRYFVALSEKGHIALAGWRQATTPPPGARHATIRRLVRQLSDVVTDAVDPRQLDIEAAIAASSGGTPQCTPLTVFDAPPESVSS